ncbi:MAG: cob(I)yrinic acid a,c-diamide adenosyltransferase [Anaerolineae bacterium]
MSGRARQRFFSGQGDDGYTSLWGGGRVPKHALQPEAYGTVDEASAAIGLARASGCHPRTAAGLQQVQRDLILAMGDLARPPERAAESPALLQADRVRWLEEQIHALEAELPPLQGFVLAGESLPGAFLHQARCVTRRAERAVARLVHEGWPGNPQVLPYLNRLSSYLFALALWEDARAKGVLVPRAAEV